MHTQFIYQVQLFLYTHIALHYGTEPYSNSGWDLKEFISVQHLLYIIRKYYSYLEDNADKDHNDLCAEIRPYLILTIKQFVTRVSNYIYVLYCILECSLSMHCEFVCVEKRNK